MILAALMAIGCQAAEQRIATDQLSALVLQPADVPNFSQFGLGAQVSADAHAGPRKDAGRFGRLGGWIARYRPADAAVSSRAAAIPATAKRTSTTKTTSDRLGASAVVDRSILTN